MVPPSLWSLHWPRVRDRSAHRTWALVPHCQLGMGDERETNKPAAEEAALHSLFGRGRVSKNYCNYFYRAQHTKGKCSFRSAGRNDRLPGREGEREQPAEKRAMCHVDSRAIQQTTTHDENDTPGTSPARRHRFISLSNANREEFLAITDFWGVEKSDSDF